MEHNDKLNSMGNWTTTANRHRMQMIDLWLIAWRANKLCTPEKIRKTHQLKSSSWKEQPQMHSATKTWDQVCISTSCFPFPYITARWGLAYQAISTLEPSPSIVCHRKRKSPVSWCSKNPILHEALQCLELPEDPVQRDSKLLLQNWWTKSE